MGTRKNPRERMRWVFWLAVGICIWLAGAFSVIFYLDGQGGAVGKPEFIASGVYLGVLFVVMAVGNFGRVRFLLALQIIYGMGVLLRSVMGTASALFFMEFPISGGVHTLLNALVRPFAGFRHVAAQLTSHFITEIYWLGLGLNAAILVFLACVSMMAVSSRIGRERAYRVRQQQRASAAPNAVQRTRAAAGKGK